MPHDLRLTLPQVMSQRLLEVADYQRPYAWGTKQLQDLWEDLDLLGAGDHYAGTLVLKEVEAPHVTTIDGDRLPRFEVVDGQQRLTTCLLLLNRVIRYLEPIGERGVDGAGRAATKLNDLFGSVSASGVDVPRLRLGTDLNDFWVDHILGNEPVVGMTLVAGEQRLRHAAEFFDERLAEMIHDLDDASATTRLLDLRSRVTSGLKFLVYEVRSDVEVGVIFETLNERGRSLSDVEKVKNYLLFLARQLPDGRRDDLAGFINQHWSKIFVLLANLPSSYEERLLRSHWLATQNPDSRQWKRTASVKEKFPRSKYVPGSARLRPPVNIGAPGLVPDSNDSIWDELYKDVKSYVQSLYACATFVAEVNNPSAPYHAFKSDSDRDRARRATAALLRSPVIALFLPLMFAARLSRPEDGAGYADLVELCERYSARVFAIAQRRSNAGEPYLCKIAYRLFNGESVDMTMERLQALLWDYAPDETVQQALWSLDNWYGRQSHKYLLYEYELSKAASPSDVKPWSEFVDSGNRRTTEHILPQNPDPDSGWWSWFSPEEHQRLHHTLGNLVLTYDNSSYSNKEYAKKRGAVDQTSPPCYYTAGLAQEREVAQWAEWTPASIEERQRELAAWAMVRWSVTPPVGEALREANDEVQAESEAVIEEEAEISEISKVAETRL